MIMISGLWARIRGQADLLPNAPNYSDLPEHPNDDSLKVVLELALHEEEELANRANWLDTKTGAVVGFVIVSVAELLGFLFLASGEKAKFSTTHPYSLATLFFIGLAALVVASLVGLVELAPMGFRYGTSVEMLVPSVDQDTSGIRLLCVDSLRRSSGHNRRIVRRKAKLAKAAVIFVAVALLFYAAAVVMLFVSLLF